MAALAERQAMLSVEQWLPQMERHGLAHVVLLTGGGNEHLSREVAPYRTRFTGFAHHSPTLPEAPALLEHAVSQLGLRGYKMIAPSMECSVSDVQLDPLWQKVEDLGIPVLIHFGVWGGAGGVPVHQNIDPLSLFPVARRHPDIRFVVPHFGSGYWRELLHLCWTCPNVSLDTSGSNQWLRWEPYPLTLSGVFRRAYEAVGPERIFYGSDIGPSSLEHGYRFLQEQVQACTEAGIPEADIRQIFGGNAARLMDLPYDKTEA